MLFSLGFLSDANSVSYLYLGLYNFVRPLLKPCFQFVLQLFHNLSESLRWEAALFFHHGTI